jgi:DNA polymerase I-like protein with 3'-5' exonuclease and polymerase domains
MLLKIDMYLESIGDVAQLIMTIHDSIIFQVPKGELGKKIAEEIKRIATDVQTAPFNLRLPFVMDSGVGDNWAVATYGEAAA